MNFSIKCPICKCSDLILENDFFKCENCNNKFKEKYESKKDQWCKNYNGICSNCPKSYIDKHDIYRCSMFKDNRTL